MPEIVCLARRSIWSLVFAVNQMISLTVVFPHTVVMRYAERYLIVVITTVRKSVILEAVLHVTRLLSPKKPVLVVNTIYKCSLAIHSLERAVQTPFLYVECLVVKSYNVGIHAPKVVMKEHALIAR